MYLVVKSSGKCTLPLMWFDTYSEAVNYCEYMDWEYMDENNYLWELGIAMTYEDMWEMLD